MGLGQADRWNERTRVEEPFMHELEGLGWTCMQLEENSPPEASFRTSYGQVILEPVLGESLRAVNPLIEEDQISRAVNRLIHIESSDIKHANIEVADLILCGMMLDGSRSRVVKYLDFKHPAENSFLAISQFKVDVPRSSRYIIPDIVLFVNGIPLVVVECKSPRRMNAMEIAIDKILKYSNIRPGAEEREGNDRLFIYNQLMIATIGEKALYSTTNSDYDRYDASKEAQASEILAEEDITKLDGQQVLIRTMLSPPLLLEMVEISHHI
jgi:type I restriction enzyme R subunit